MERLYPDLAFKPYMQVLLFLINLITTTLSYYWGASLLLQIFQKRVGFKRKLLFSTIAAIFLNLLVVYGISFFNGLITEERLLYIGNLEILTKNVFPWAYFILYWIGVRILKLSAVKSVTMMQFAYVYFIACNLSIRIFSKIFIHTAQDDPRGWNFLIDIYKLVGGTIIIYGIYRLLAYLVHKGNFNTVFPDNITVKSVPKSLFKNFLVCCGAYALITIIYYYPGLDVVHFILLLILFLTYFYLGITFEFSKILRRLLINRNEHIVELNHAIEEFRGVKHDFNNILQTYSGYLSMEAYEELKQYHAKMVGTTLFAENYLDLSKRFPENPTFFSLLIQKLEYAKALGVFFEVRSLCNMESIGIDALDFNRTISVLFDNAIEEAAKTPQKLVILSTQSNTEGSKLFILSNDTNEDVDIKEIFLPGYTTKPGHMGQGLSQVRNTLNKYGNVTLNFTSYKHNFTVYLEVRPDFI